MPVPLRFEPSDLDPMDQIHPYRFTHAFFVKETPSFPNINPQSLPV